MNTIKDYYVEILNLYNSSIKILTALNTALTSQSATVPLSILEEDSGETVYNIPSFLYLENKVQGLESSINTLMDMPKTGEAWFQKNSEVYKLSMVSASSAPSSIALSLGEIPVATISENSLFKDLVFPKLVLRCRVDELAPDISEIVYKKVVFHNVGLFNLIRASGLTSLSDIQSLLAGYELGVEWDIYEAKTTLPVRSRDSDNRFGIERLLTSDNVITWGTLSADDTTNTDFIGKAFYDVQLTNTQYFAEDDPSRVRYLKPGMKLQTSTGYAKITIVDVPDEVAVEFQETDNIFRLIVTAGQLDMHLFDEQAEESWSQAYNTYLQEDDDTWMSYSYIDIPLEENPYICLFIASIRNNMRSSFTRAMFYNLDEIYMVDETGSYISNQDGKKYSYIEYYNQFAKNAGDTLMSLVYSAQPGVDSITRTELTDLQVSSQFRPLISPSDLQVTAINSHLSDDTSVDYIKTLHAQKSEFLAELETIKQEIQTILSSVASTDFESATDSARTTLTLRLLNAYANRTRIEKQIIAVVNDINSSANAAVLSMSEIKYRLRGHIDTSVLDTTLKAFNPRINLVGLDIQYKYKSISKETTTATAIHNVTFTSWNRYQTDLKPRKPVYKNGQLTFEEDIPTDSDNVIKWNQVDIPIQQGEDVVVRVRGIYNIGQPFLTLYTPWSEETTFEFPQNYTVNADMQNILDTNRTDSTTATVTSKLIEDGYEEHISNKLVDNNVIYFHQPENIASGFYTTEQKIIPLKDKLWNMQLSMDTINKELEQIKKSDYKVYAVYDGHATELTPETMNTLTVKSFTERSSNSQLSTFVSDTITIVIKNTALAPLYLYSIFPGDTLKMLTSLADNFTGNSAASYEMLPINVNGGFQTQRLGQWIYFRNTNPYTEAYDNIYITENFKRDSFTLADSNYFGPQITDEVNNESDPVRDTNDSYFRYSVLASDKQLGFRPKPHLYMSLKQYNKWNKLKLKLNNKQEVSGLEVVEADYMEINKQRWDNESQYFYIPMNFIGRYDGIPRENIEQEKIRAYNQKYYSEETPTQDELNSILSQEDSGWNIGYGLKQNQDDLRGDIKYQGGFLFPELPTWSIIQVESSFKESYKTVLEGEEISVPLTFQYYLQPDNSGLKYKTSYNISQVTKTIYFDIRPGVLYEPKHYMLSVTALYATGTTNVGAKVSTTYKGSYGE